MLYIDYAVANNRKYEAIGDTEHGLQHIEDNTSDKPEYVCKEKALHEMVSIPDNPIFKLSVQNKERMEIKDRYTNTEIKN